VSGPSYFFVLRYAEPHRNLALRRLRNAAASNTPELIKAHVDGSGEAATASKSGPNQLLETPASVKPAPTYLQPPDHSKSRTNRRKWRVLV